MQLPDFFQGVQRWLQDVPRLLKNIPTLAYFIAIPIPIFVLTVAITLATSNGGDDDPELAVAPSNTPSLANIDEPATATPTSVPATPTVEPTAAPANRENCDEIQGTDYLSPQEREWYLANCLGGGQTANTDTTGGGGAPPAGGGGGGGGTTGGGAVSAGEYHLGARLIIPAAGIDASVTGMDVGANGAMPDPAGYFNAVLYNFPFQQGLGGPNKVLAGHVDCGRCYNGGPGVAVFWSVRDLPVGATAQFVNPDGTVQNYVVSNSYAISANTDFSGIVAGGAADMTIITCTGTFAGGHYDDRHVVTFQLQG